MLYLVFLTYRKSVGDFFIQQKRINKERYGSLDKLFEQLIIASFVLTTVTKTYVCGMHAKNVISQDCKFLDTKRQFKECLLIQLEAI